MKKICLLGILSFALAACHKDPVETKPHLSFKDWNSNVIGQNGTLRVTLNFTDKEGDLQSLYVVRQRMNVHGPDRKVLPYDIPDFNGQNQGEIQVTLDYNYDLTLGLDAIHVAGSNPPQNEPDTLQLKFYVEDKAGHVSDSTSPKQVIVIR